MGERVFDDDWDDWKVGDCVVYADFREDVLLKIAYIDEYQRVFWIEDGVECLTRVTNMLRVRGEDIGC